MFPQVASSGFFEQKTVPLWNWVSSICPLFPNTAGEPASRHRRRREEGHHQALSLSDSSASCPANTCRLDHFWTDWITIYSHYSGRGFTTTKNVQPSASKFTCSSLFQQSISLLFGLPLYLFTMYSQLRLGRSMTHPNRHRLWSGTIRVCVIITH